MSDRGGIRLFRSAHGGHLASYVERGLLCRRMVLAEGIEFRSISNEEIEDRRATTVVPCRPGGYLHDYIPFHFGPRSPMMYRISRRNLPAYTDGQRPLLYLVTSVAAIETAGLAYVFTDGHPLSAITDIFDDATQLERVDHALMEERYWFDTEDDPDRQRRRQAELLIHRQVPWSVVEEIGVMDGAIANRVEQILGDLACTHRPPVVVRRGWYYDEG